MYERERTSLPVYSTYRELITAMARVGVTEQQSDNGGKDAANNATVAPSGVNQDVRFTPILLQKMCFSFFSHLGFSASST